MSEYSIPNNLKKIDRTDMVEFLNTAPNETSPDWAILGVGIADKAKDYNAEVTEENGL